MQRPPLLRTLAHSARALTWRDVRIVAVRAALVLLALEVAYLVGANAVVKSRLISDGVGAAEGMRLDYTWAQSWLPGRVHVRGLTFRVEDYNVQFEVGIANASLDVSLHELWSKKFHVTKLRADGVTFRMRHKVPEIGKDGARLAAYPPIPGFSDPPLYRGTAPPPIPDAEYDLWSLQIEDVVAQVKELWALEYRFQGDAEARGSFVVRPARWVQVEPAALELRSGTLRVGSEAVAAVIKGRITCSVPDLDVQATEGAAVLRQISSTLALRLSGGDLAFTDVYWRPRLPGNWRGPVEWVIRADVQRGRVQPGTEFTLRAPQTRFEAPSLAVSGAMGVRFFRQPEREALQLEANLVGARLEARGPCVAPPVLKSLLGSLELLGIDLSQAMKLGAQGVSGALAVSDLACVQSALGTNAPAEGARLAGRADVSFSLGRDATGKGAGRAEVDVRGGRYDKGSVHVHGDGRALSNFQLEGGERPYAQGAVSVHLSSAESLLSAAVAATVRKILSSTLDLGALDANVAFHADDDALSLELTQAVSGALSGKGYMRRVGERKPYGAALLTSGILHVGLELEQGEMRVAPLVSQRWLATTWSELEARAKEPKAGQSAIR